MKYLNKLALLGAVMLLSACATPSISHYDNTTPEINIQAYFDGPVQAWGIVQNWRGNVTRKFDIEMVGSWDGDVGTLEEDFVYDDGETQRRVWTIKKLSENTYEGFASDIKGKATGQSNGNAVQWKYQMNLKVGDKTYLVTFDDWMFAMKDEVLVNRSYIKKFGITVAEVTIFMKKK